jgi:hypothetical protein
MMVTFLVAAIALVVAVIGCALVAPSDQAFARENSGMCGQKIERPFETLPPAQPASPHQTRPDLSYLWPESAILGRCGQRNKKPTAD